VSLNEKLAEVCGYPYMTNDLGCFVERATCKWLLWNPTTDLNQLRECYLELSEDEKAFVHIKFAVPFNDLTNKWPSDRDNLFAIFEHPELVAQAILKAKGVE